MDQTLLQTIGKPKAGSSELRFPDNMTVCYVDEGAGDIEVVIEETVKPYRLKPVDELYAPDSGTASINIEADAYMPLTKSIESAILEYFLKNPGLTDGTVQLALDRLALQPGADPIKDELCQNIQLGMRITLSLNNYSKREVVAALRKISRSVQRHSRLSGHRGYLEFIERFFNGYYQK